jgi:hypothetical protein
MSKLSVITPVVMGGKGGASAHRPSRSPCVPHGPAQSKTRKYVNRAILGFGLSAVLLLLARKYWETTTNQAELSLPVLNDGSQSSTVTVDENNKNFTWSDITPSRELDWHSCYDDQFDCARVDLPMDWLEPSEDHRIILAVIRLRADVEPNSLDYKGPVFFNPGGPGGSGVWAMLDRGRRIQAITGRNHDIITFDPRGIGGSLPRVDCWRSAEKQRIWDLQDLGIVDAYPGIVNDAFIRAGAYSQVCQQAMEGSQLLNHISTPSHARDMLELLRLTGHDKLRFWGFSYGTILGGYFAALYPDKVERLVSDGE